jgi:hypothetical protein
MIRTQMVVVLVKFLTAMCTVEYILTTINTFFFPDNYTHERVTQVISVGLLKFAWDYSQPTRSVCSNVSG